MAPAAEPLHQFRRHRELLLRQIGSFVGALKEIETRLVARLFKSRGYRTGVFFENDPLGGRPLRMEPNQLARRQRERIEWEVDSDPEAIAFQRRWRVLIVATHQPGLGLSFLDDFFLEPSVAPDSPYLRLGSVYPGRFVIVDRQAGRNAVEEALTKKLRNRPKGEVSRLPSKPPFELQAGRDHTTEDVEIVRVCGNGNMPVDFDEVIANKLFRDVARRAGWRQGRRLLNHAPVEAAAEWTRHVRRVRKRWLKLERVLGPFQDA
jgi:hypothetical protein